jgi:hypothetical protein
MIKEKEIAVTEMKINRLLAELEKAIHVLVNDIRLDSIEITQMEERTPVVMRGVRISVERQPGTRWNVL